MDSKDHFISCKKARELLGISTSTLRRYDTNGTIETIRTPGNTRLYNVQKFIRTHGNYKAGERICYCRVSSNGQKNDLASQIEYMKKKYPEHRIISDIGSGVNFKRKGLIEIIKLAIDGKLSEVVVAYKDRLCRVGYELLEMIITEYSRAKIIIENNESENDNEKMVKDVMEILTVYVARIHGKRRYNE